MEGFAPDDPKGKQWVDVKQIEREYTLLAKQYEEFKKQSAKQMTVQYEAS